MTLLDEFKTFVARGNAVDLAIGVVIGAAFGKVVSSLVSDVIMPPIGLLLGGVDFSKLQITLVKASEGVQGVAIRYGAFLNTVIDFVIIAAAIFAVIKLMNEVVPKKPDPVTTKECPECAMPVPVKARLCGHCGSKLP